MVRVMVTEIVIGSKDVFVYHFFLMWKRREREVGVKDLGNLTGSSKYMWGISPGEAESVFIK